MAAAGRNGPLAPHMRQDDPPSKRVHFLLGSGGGYPSRHGDGNGDGDGDGDSDGDGDGDGDGDSNGDNNNNQTTIN